MTLRRSKQLSRRQVLRAAGGVGAALA
nr:twin-arginine translocation signal domain-containing protein [Chloroflexia bacterium]